MEVKKEVEFKLPVSLVQEIVNYLGNRPFVEVRNLIDQIMQHNPNIKKENVKK